MNPNLAREVEKFVSLIVPSQFLFGTEQDVVAALLDHFPEFVVCPGWLWRRHELSFSLDRAGDISLRLGGLQRGYTTV